MCAIARFSLVCLMLAGVAIAAEPALPIPAMSPPVSRESGRLSFELLPKSFQKNPQLEMTAVCEFTPYGRTLPQATPAHPVYYFGVNSGFVQRGENVGGEHPPAPDYLGRLLQRALQANGFRAADKAHPPTLALFFQWGSHSAMDGETSELFPQKHSRELLERAVLVGGHGFQKALANRLTYGDSILDHTAKINFLTEQASDNLYFIVVSAYDMAALQHRERRLVWRTNLTVDATGVSMTDSLPALVLTGAPYFGRDMADAEILFRRVQRGVVTLGPEKFIGTEAPGAPAK